MHLLKTADPIEPTDLGSSAPGVPELRLVGDVTQAGLAHLDERLQQHVDAGGGVVEMSLVTFLPAAAAAVLTAHVLAAAQRCIVLQIVARPPCIASRVLTVLAIPHRQG